MRAGLKTPGTYSLSFVYVTILCVYIDSNRIVFCVYRFSQRVRHYHLYHDGESHYVGKNQILLM